MRKERPFWMVLAVRKLETYMLKLSAVSGLRDDLRELKSSFTAIRSARTNATPSSGGGSRREDAMLNNIANRELTERNLRGAIRECKRIEGALDTLTKEERLILDRFYINAEKGATNGLASDLGVDVKTVYARKDDALYRFTLAYFGAVDL